MKKIVVFLLYIFCSFSTDLFSQQFNEKDLKRKLTETFTDIYKQNKISLTKITVDSLAIDSKKRIFEVYSNTALSYLPMRKEIVNEIYNGVRINIPEDYKKYNVRVFSDNKEISTLIPNFYLTKAKDKSRIFKNDSKKPLVTNLSLPINIKNGLSGNHIALWNSHGWYYEQKIGRWEWQRARIFQTVEDLYTQSYVLPFLVPMLENAGANVLLPRERDYISTEYIIDNDGKSNYQEIKGKESWQNTSAKGFAHIKQFYLDGENPFLMGTARQVNSITKGQESKIVWNIPIEKEGNYGVYISYQSQPKSTEDARYTVYHNGGKTEFSINQKMGGGTWIFLGYFPFSKGNNPRVELTNLSKKSGNIITADAIKVGGGMGNIARMPNLEGFESQNTKSSETSKNIENILPNITYKPMTSGYPRFAEGARYWMQWAGVPDTIYNRTQGKNDYTDDYSSRGYWVNWLSGGSSVNPKVEGLKVPVDLAFAFHTDAGTLWGDSIVGTLGIFMTNHNNEKFANGYSRWASRDLTELIMSEITNDIRREFEPNWTRRHMWNRSYAEARVPEVPTMLLELLSHQNFADMRYGLDPNFRFTVSRSVYKGMLKFIASQYQRPYKVQPLPVKDFQISFLGENEVELKWAATPDVSEPSAMPNSYIIYTRIDNGGFDNGKVVKENHATLKIDKDKIYSFKIEAVNEGGKSFPSEILSACRKSDSKGNVMIVNGFTRVSAPYSFTASNDSIAGFYGDEDYGVPYISEHQFIGSQNEFRRIIPWKDDDASGFGDSYGNYETKEIAGNTFDYPKIHGEGFAKAGYSFVSCASSVVENGAVKLSDYKVVDWILGKQREWTVARGAMPSKYKTFSNASQNAITQYCNTGGNIIVSGSNVGTDLWENPRATKEDRDWAEKTLKFFLRNSKGATEGRVKAVPSPFSSIQGEYNYYNELNSECYVVENPDAIEPIDKNGFTIFRYSENNLSAGTMFKGEKYATCILGFPIESVKGQDNRNCIIKDIMQAFGF